MPQSKTVTWDEVLSTSIPELVIGQVTRDLVGQPRGTFKEVPGKDGSWFFGQARGRREIRAQCFILADSIAERRTVMEEVANWLDVTTEAKLELSDEPGIYYMAVLSEAPQPAEWRELGTFELAWQAQPYSYDNEPDTESFTADADELHSWDPGLVVYTYPIIEITPTNGTLTGFSLETNGDTLFYSGLVADDATLTINSIAGVVLQGSNLDIELTGAYDPLASDMGGVSGKFPVLLPGVSNTVHFVKSGGTATSITVDITYRKRYRR